MSATLNGRRIAILATDGVEQVELEQPRDAVTQAGGRCDLIALKSGEIQAMNHMDKGDRFAVDRTVGDVRADEYDGLLLPGGVTNPGSLRVDDAAVGLVRDFVTSGKPIGVICHGPWTLVEAGVLEGRTLTSWPSLRTDIENAGGSWVDKEVVTDRGIVSSRKPDDLPAFCAKVVEEFAEGVHDRS